MTVRIGVVTFPGSLDDVDARRAVRIAGAEPVALWHASHDLDGVDALILPGGFSYGDYLRAGAIAALAPIMRDVKDAAAKGMPVLGICNGFQMLVEAHLLPGGLIRNAHQQFIRRDQRLRVENTSTAWTSDFADGQEIVIPLKNADGGYVASDDELDRLEGDERAARAQPRHHADLRQRACRRLDRGVGRDDVGGEEGHGCRVLLARLVLLAVQRQGALEAVAREVVGEHVRQAHRGGELRRVVARPEQPHLRLRRRGRGGGHTVRAARGELHGRALRARDREDVADVVGEALHVARRARAVQQLGDDRVAAGRAPDSEVDAAGREGLERRELLGDDERRVVGKHDAARTHPDARRAGRGRGDQHGRRRRGDGRHVVVLGEPVARVAELVGAVGEREGCRDRRGARLVGAHGHEVEDGKGGAHRVLQRGGRGIHSPAARAVRRGSASPRRRPPGRRAACRRGRRAAARRPNRAPSGRCSGAAGRTSAPGSRG